MLISWKKPWNFFKVIQDCWNHYKKMFYWVSQQLITIRILLQSVWYHIYLQMVNLHIVIEFLKIAYGEALFLKLYSIVFKKQSQLMLYWIGLLTMEINQDKTGRIFFYLIILKYLLLLVLINQQVFVILFYWQLKFFLYSREKKLKKNNPFYKL